jgi:hypothetical protein
MQPAGMPSALLEERLALAIEEGRPVEIRGSVFSDGYRENLELAMGRLLDSIQRADLAPIVGAVAQELCLWASLANMRQIYFENHGLNLNDADVVAREEPGFLASVTSDSADAYRLAARDRGLYLRTRITLRETAIVIQVANNAVHSPALEERLRAELRRAMAYNDIMEYFRDHPDDPDGRGLGLAFSLLMLREQRLRPELLRLGQSDGRMVSRAEIPFDELYRSIRDRLESGEDVRPFDSSSGLSGLEVQDIITVACPVCGRDVDERVFFIPVPDDLIDSSRVRGDRPDWTPLIGACASCIAVYG